MPEGWTFSQRRLQRHCLVTSYLLDLLEATSHVLRSRVQQFH